MKLRTERGYTYHGTLAECWEKCRMAGEKAVSVETDSGYCTDVSLCTSVEQVRAAMEAS